MEKKEETICHWLKEPENCPTHFKMIIFLR